MSLDKPLFHYSIYLLKFLGVFALLSTPKILELSDKFIFKASCLLVLMLYDK